MNTFNAIGRVGQDSVVRYTAAQEPVLGFRLAVDSGFGDKQHTVWLDCALWGKRAEKLAQYIVKGAQLGVCGELGIREHEGKTYLKLRVADVTLCGSKQAEPQQKAA